jgi:hypothetical protein
MSDIATPFFLPGNLDKNLTFEYKVPRPRSAEVADGVEKLQ